MAPREHQVPGTNILVDAFKAYQLTFINYHYGGITVRWPYGLIYCTEVTRNLLVKHMHIHAELIVSLPMNTPCYIDNFKVTLIDANHCPGAAIFIFEVFDIPKSAYSQKEEESASDQFKQLNDQTLPNLNEVQSLLPHLNGSENEPQMSSVDQFVALISAFSATSNSGQTSINNTNQSSQTNQRAQTNKVYPEPQYPVNEQHFSLQPPLFLKTDNLPPSRLIVHTGDFRYANWMKNTIHDLIGVRQIDGLYYNI
ncbi:MAG: hypothetical protein EZS28_036031 [Streblomastix strix]|uniref:Uncharacterized protein n=1 Tax=Streblomastix strix TaxID=222440 RepID=A0A5J4UEL2_9EUKA|nr:MAG: hypothetical protein EZS28_036031 [Streblomastix strix]